MKPTTCSSSRGRCSAYVYANLYFALEMEEGEKKKCSGLWWGELWSEIKQTAPLQRTSFYLCDVKSKLINKGSRFQGVLSQIQGVEAFHFHQRSSPTWVNSRLATAQLSLFWCRSLLYSILSQIKEVSLAPGRHFIAATNHLSKYLYGFGNARNWGSCRKWASVPLRKEMKTEKLISMMCFGDCESAGPEAAVEHR